MNTNLLAKLTEHRLPALRGSELEPREPEEGTGLEARGRSPDDIVQPREIEEYTPPEEPEERQITETAKPKAQNAAPGPSSQTVKITVQKLAEMYDPVAAQAVNMLVTAGLLDPDFVAAWPRSSVTFAGQLSFLADLNNDSREKIAQLEQRMALAEAAIGRLWVLLQAVAKGDMQAVTAPNFMKKLIKGSRSEVRRLAQGER